MKNTLLTIGAGLIAGGVLVAGVVTSEPTPDVVLIDGQTITVPVTVSEIKAAEEAYFQKNGVYLQVLQGDKLADDQKGSASEILGVTIPPEMVIDVYDAPEGPGYVISYKDSTSKYSFGSGPEADKTTFIVDKSIDRPLIASSTVDVVK